MFHYCPCTTKPYSSHTEYVQIIEHASILLTDVTTPSKFNILPIGSFQVSLKVKPSGKHFLYPRHTFLKMLLLHLKCPACIPNKAILLLYCFMDIWVENGLWRKNMYSFIFCIPVLEWNFVPNKYSKPKVPFFSTIPCIILQHGISHTIKSSIVFLV